MQYEITWNPEATRVAVRTSGLASADGIAAFVNEVLDTPAWRPGTDLLIDHRKLDLSEMPTDAAHAIATLFADRRDRLGGGRCAIIMTTEPVEKGIARTWQSLTEAGVAMTIRIFDALDEAEAWLDRPRND